MSDTEENTVTDRATGYTGKNPEDSHDNSIPISPEPSDITPEIDAGTRGDEELSDDYAENDPEREDDDNDYDDDDDASPSHSHSSSTRSAGAGQNQDEGSVEDDAKNSDHQQSASNEATTLMDDDESNNKTDTVNPTTENNGLEEKAGGDMGHETTDDGDNDNESVKGKDNGNETDDSESNKEREDEAERAGPSRPRRIMLSSDEEDDMDRAPASPKSKEEDSDSEGDREHAEVGVGELMTNIFGEDSDDNDDDGGGKEDENVNQQADRGAPEGDDDEPRYVRDEEDEDDGRIWDFDTMMREKKAERRRPRRRRRDGSIDVGGAYDDQIKMLIDAMKAAAKDDRHSNMERRPALQKRKMLPHVKAMLIKHDLMEAVIDNGMMNVISEWLAPLPDKSLPALEIRTDLLKILQDYSRLEPGTLKQSGLGRAVMLLYKHPRETKENKALAARLISDWARPIFQLDTDFRSMTKDERIQRDYAQLPEAKRRRLDAGSENSDVEKEVAEPRPGDKGFIMRARVPRPSQKDYVVRPKSNVEGQFRGATKNRSNSRFDRTQREFKERTKQQRAQRAIGVSINRITL